MFRYLLTYCTLVLLVMPIVSSGQTSKKGLLQEWNSLQQEDVDSLLSEQIRISLAYWHHDVLGADSLMDIMLGHPQIMEYPDRYVTGIWIKNNRTPRSEEKLQRYYNIDSIACELDVSPYVKVDVKHFWARMLYYMRYHERSVNIYEEAVELATNYDLSKRSMLIASLSNARKEYDTDQKEKILMLKKDQEIKLSEERIRRYKISGLLAALLLALGLFTMLQLRKRNIQIKDQNTKISKALTEKDLLLREIHHRVKNNLQLVSSLLTLQGRSIDDEMAQQAMQEGQSRVRSMALIHQDLYNKENLTDISVKEYIEKLIQELFATYRIDDNRIYMSMEVDDVDLDVDTLVPLGLIINELLTNSLKYAFPGEREGKLSVTFVKSDGKCSLTVEDDGVGYDPLQVRENSFGSTLVKALVEQLEGQLSVDVESGTTIKIIFSDRT